ncbi:LysR family transcriptional regulator [Pseudotabrizicola alkalilacus]|uniref:LysR family transcriptional regulator n=1 Tax=Pseudotabrizicola alkalilacus TaxID=2305252 RepID=A0A411YXG1_9RHOB|nr:LysR family transcriptional regulator [Pseudotabrizicola alkalilacus]RGP35584.1 LysR family transcriptional regulator [Pseudotabrizicola alkalilacus]
MALDRPDLPLNGLRVFEAALRQGSFTRAAIELRVTQAAVSHQIARLEDRLGVTLFLRTSGGLVPTEEGRALYPVVEHGFDAIARVLDRITGQRHIEILNVGVVTTFAVGWLLPRLAAFQHSHPAIDLRISTNNNRVEILREGLDMAIRYGAGNWTGLKAELLVDAPLSPLCAPSVADRLATPDDLGREVLLRSYRGDEWPRWFARVDGACPPLTGPIFDSSVAIANIAVDGGGVALLPVAMFIRHIDEGRLVQPFAAQVSAGSYYLTWPADRPATPEMADFAKWLHAELLDENDTGYAEYRDKGVSEIS